MSLGIGKDRNPLELAKHGAVTTLEPGAEMEGKLRVSAGIVRINSHFKGEIAGDGSLVVAEQGEVEADVSLKVISVMGKIKGSVHATERIEIKERGVILGDITTPVLLVEAGGYFDGQCHMPVQPVQPAEAARPPLELEKDASERPSRPQ